jgi:hypothetical protein
MIAKPHLSWVMFGLGGLAGFLPDVESQLAWPRWLVALAGGYVLWTLFWDSQDAWYNRYPALGKLEQLIPRKLQDRLWRRSLLGLLFLIWVFLFSILGGGLYKYVRALRLRL